MFISLTSRYGNATVVHKLWNEIRNSYSEPVRHYHNLSHLGNLLANLDRYKEKLEDWEVVQLAVFYHDIVYDVSRQDNEEKSSELAERAMRELNLDPQKIERCKRHILATKDHQATSDPDTNWFLDADLSILGAPFSEYKKYARQIRSEFSIYDDALYKSGRIKILNSLVELQGLFKTAVFKDQFERQARKNMRMELESLGFSDRQI